MFIGKESKGFGIDILNDKLPPYTASKEWIQHQSEIKKNARLIKNTKNADDLCENMFDGDIEAGALEEKNRAGIQKNKHLARLKYNYDRTRGAVYRKKETWKQLENKKKRLTQDGKTALSIFSRNKIVLILILLFCITDTCSVFSGIDSVTAGNPFFTVLLAIVSAAILDVPMSIAGNVYKQYTCGAGRSKNEVKIIVITSIVAFLIIFTAVFSVRLVTVNQVNDTGSTIKNQIQVAEEDTVEAEEEAEEKPSASDWIGAIFLGILPLATSVASFVVTYAVSDPEEDALAAIADIDKKLIQIGKSLEEIGAVEHFYRQEIIKEEQAYQAYLKLVDSTVLELKEFVILQFMHHKTDSAAQISRLAESGRKMIPKFEPETSKDYLDSFFFAAQY